MLSIGDFLTELRVAYLKDPKAKRFPFRIIKPYFMASLKVLLAKSPPAFYGLYTAEQVAELDALGEDVFLAIDLNTILDVRYFPALQNAIWGKTNASNVRGVSRPDPLRQQQEVKDMPR